MAFAPAAFVKFVPVEMVTAVLPAVLEPVTTPFRMMSFNWSCKNTVLLLEVTPPATLSTPGAATVSVPPVLATSTKPPVALAVTLTLPVFDSHMPPALNVPLVAMIFVAAVLIGSVPVTVPPMAVPAVRVKVLAVTVKVVGTAPTAELMMLLLGAFSVKSTLEVPMLLSTMNVLLAKVPSVTKLLCAALEPLAANVIRLVFSVLSSIKLILPTVPVPAVWRFIWAPVVLVPAIVLV